MDINLGPDRPTPKWNGQSVEKIDNLQLVQILRHLQKLAEVKRHAIKWALCVLLEECSTSIKSVFEVWRNEVMSQTWEDFTEPIFLDLLGEAYRRDLVWNIGIEIEKEIDLSMRGPLERQIVGAIRDCINAHGPVTRETANSAAKRVIGAIKTFNRKVRKDVS